MKTATFKQQDYKISCSQKTRNSSTISPRWMDIKTQKKLKTNQQVFSDNKRKSLYIFICILKTAASKREFLLLFFLRRFLTGQYNKFSNLFPTAFLNLDPPLTIYTIPLAGTTGSM
jgi:hypothetical protein